MSRSQSGLGEMQTLAAGVGDLKKVLSNVKTRGIVGEIQLGAILAQILSPDQYDENVAVKGGSERVEYAVRFPGDGMRPVYLPVDSKFPADAYIHLTDAYDTGDRDLIKAASDALKNAVIKAARDIRTKYIQPPETTEFAIMFLPFDGPLCRGAQAWHRGDTSARLSYQCGRTDDHGGDAEQFPDGIQIDSSAEEIGRSLGHPFESAG